MSIPTIDFLKSQESCLLVTKSKVQIDGILFGKNELNPKFQDGFETKFTKSNGLISKKWSAVLLNKPNPNWHVIFMYTEENPESGIICGSHIPRDSKVSSFKSKGQFSEYSIITFRSELEPWFWCEVCIDEEKKFYNNSGSKIKNQ